MYPKAFTSAQATLRAYATVGIVVFAAASVVVGVEVLAPHGSSGGHYNFMVAFQNGSQSLPGPSGTAPIRTVTDVPYELRPSTNNSGFDYITNVTFTISWMDQTISPFFNPAVTATITGPNGTGSISNRVQTTGTPLSVAVPNQMPDNTTVSASSPEDALTMAGTGNNATLGVGEWTISLNVGSPIGPRPGGTISYSIAVEVEYFSGAAVRV